MTIVEFIEARIAEDEQAAKDATEAPWNLRLSESDDKILTESGHTLIYGASYKEVVLEVYENDLLHMSRHDPARVLRQCEALRRILDDYKRYLAEERRRFNGWVTEKDSPITLAIASIWLDHPDYREDWSAQQEA